jgi:diaminohydroxyphosphoribosylaminopyrimidine deaminase/5-amino-6-(5-phosphoribosylamino)uracil reductase
MTPAPNPSPGPGDRGEDLDAMHRALALGASVRNRTAPNPWVGALVSAGGRWYEGATEPPGGPHAEVVALAAAGDLAVGGTLYTTLEPCAHQGLTPPCTGAILASGVTRVVVGVLDPDPLVSGRGVDELRRAGLEVVVGVASAEVTELLAPYLKHRRTGRPWVVLKLAATLDGRIAAPDGSSRWITGDEARADVHRLRAASDAVLVGAGTVRADDPELTVRPGPSDAGPSDAGPSDAQPLRVVLGQAPPDARVLPALEMTGELDTVLDELGARGILQVLVEGGARVAHAFHHKGVVDRYVLYLAPAFFGGDDALPMFAGTGAPTMEGIWRGRLVSVIRLGDDLRVELEAA